MSARKPPIDCSTMPPRLSIRLPTDRSLALASPSNPPLTRALAMGMRSPTPIPTAARQTNIATKSSMNAGTTPATRHSAEPATAIVL